MPVWAETGVAVKSPVVTSNSKKDNRIICQSAERRRHFEDRGSFASKPNGDLEGLNR